MPALHPGVQEPWRHDWRRGAWVDSYNLRAVKQTRVTVV